MYVVLAIVAASIKTHNLTLRTANTLAVLTKTRHVWHCLCCHGSCQGLDQRSVAA